MSAAPRMESRAGGVVLRDLSGIALRGASVAYPSMLAGDGARFDAARAYEELLGEHWMEVLAARGHDAEHVARAYGIEVREWCRGSGVSCLDLGERAATRCLERVRWRPDDIDLLIAATSTPTHATQCFAASIAARLGSGAAAIDVRGGGAGGLDAWITATTYLRAGARRALVVAAEATSLWLDGSTGASALLYGDGAAALALEVESPGEPATDAGLAFSLQSRGDAAGIPFTVPGELPPQETAVESGATEGHAPHGRVHPYRFQAPDAAYQHALAAHWTAAVHEFAAELGTRGVGLYLPYSVTRFQVEAGATILHTDPHFALEHLARRGSLGCAGPLAALAEYLESIELPAPRTVSSLAVGGGVRIAALHWRLAASEPARGGAS